MVQKSGKLQLIWVEYPMFHKISYVTGRWQKFLNHQQYHWGITGSSYKYAFLLACQQIHGILLAAKKKVPQRHLIEPHPQIFLEVLKSLQLLQSLMECITNLILYIDYMDV